MTQKKKRSETTAAPVATTRGAASKVMPKAAPLASTGALSDVSGRGTTFEGTLRYVIGLADAVALEPSSVPGASSDVASTSAGAADVASAGAADVAPAGAASSPATRRLADAIEELGPDTALKLRTLMVAGRDGRGVTAVHVDAKPVEGDVSAAADLSANGAQLGDYLRRGHAMACATGFDIERNITAWPASAPHTLDERAWLSFGVQLAKSRPEDWTCLGFVGADAQQLTKLYLRLGEHAWWSFRSLLDRPSAALVDKEKRALSSRRSKGLTTASLKPMADRSCGTEGRALRRAVKAIRARVGVAGEPA